MTEVWIRVVNGMEMALRQHYWEQFAQVETQLAGAELPAQRRARRRSLTLLVEQEAPPVLASTRYNVLADGAPPVSPAEVAHWAVPGTHLLVFVNGSYAPDLSHSAAVRQHARFGSLAMSFAYQAERIEAQFGEQTVPLQGGLEAHNGAFWTDGAYLDLAAGVTIEQPIELLFVTTKENLGGAARNLIHVDEGARAMVIEHHVSLGPCFTNVKTCIVMQRRARLNHVRLQCHSGRAVHVGDTSAVQREASQLRSHLFALGGAHACDALRARFDGPCAGAHLNGLGIGGARQHFEHATRVAHHHPDCHCRQHYQWILADTAQAVFRPAILVKPGAARNQIALEDHCLLLSRQARARTEPRLEWENDAVTLDRHSSAAPPDPGQLASLRGGGLDALNARATLGLGFAADLLGSVEFAPLRERLRQLLACRLREILETEAGFD